MADIKEREKAAYNRRINDAIEDGRDPKSTMRAIRDSKRAPVPYRSLIDRDSGRSSSSESDSAKRDLNRGGYDAMLGINPEESGYKKGGMIKRMASGGAVRGDGVAARGKTKGRMI